MYLVGWREIGYGAGYKATERLAALSSRHDALVIFWFHTVRMVVEQVAHALWLLVLLHVHS